jgi:hypothetical protein
LRSNGGVLGDARDFISQVISVNTNSKLNQEFESDKVVISRSTKSASGLELDEFVVIPWYQRLVMSTRS